MSTIDVFRSSVSLTPMVHDIGVILDSGLDMLAQVSNTCLAAYFNLFRFAKIRTSLTITACKTLVHSLVKSRIDYGNTVLYGISNCLLHRLEMVQRLAARVVLWIRRSVHTNTNYLSPSLASLITPYIPRCALRSADCALLTVPCNNLEHYGRCSFSRAGPTLWKALPEDRRLTGYMDTFKARLKTHYFKFAFNVYLYIYIPLIS